MTRWLYPSILVTLAALGFSGYVYYFRYDELPELIPTHWDIHFRPDAWTPKEDIASSFFLVPGIMAGVVALTLVLPWLSPKRFEIDRFRDTYGYLMFLVTLLIGFVHVVILLGSLGAEDFGKYLLAGMMVFFALIGNQLGRVRRNFWMGVRTPWTLADEKVWNQTHRVAGWLFVGYGLVGAVVAVLDLVPFAVLFGLLLVVVLAPVVYSLVLYKRLEKQGKLSPSE